MRLCGLLWIKYGFVRVTNHCILLFMQLFNSLDLVWYNNSVKVFPGTPNMFHNIPGTFSLPWAESSACRYKQRWEITSWRTVIITTLQFPFTATAVITSWYSTTKRQNSHSYHAAINQRKVVKQSLRQASEFLSHSHLGDPEQHSRKLPRCLDQAVLNRAQWGGGASRVLYKNNTAG